MGHLKGGEPVEDRYDEAGVYDEAEYARDASFDDMKTTTQLGRELLAFLYSVGKAMAEYQQTHPQQQKRPLGQPYNPADIFKPGSVYLCKRKTQIRGIFSIVNGVAYHFWLRTDEKEMGLGPLGGGVPGQDEPPDSPYVTQTAIVDHKGEFDKPGSSCEIDPDANAKLVNQQLELGKPEDRFTIFNNCWFFVQRVLWNSYSEDVQNKKLAH